MPISRSVLGQFLVVQHTHTHQYHTHTHTCKENATTHKQNKKKHNELQSGAKVRGIEEVLCAAEMIKRMAVRLVYQAASP